MNKLINIKQYIKGKFKSFKKDSFEYFYNSGIDFYDKNDYEKAIKQFLAAIEKPNVKPQVYYNLALCHQCLKDYDKAIANYNKFLALKPDDYDGLYNLALTYFLKEDYANASVFFEKGLKIKTDEDGIKSLVLSYLNNNEQEKALEFAEKFLEQPNGLDLYAMVAKVFENKNSLSKDYRYIDVAIRMYSKLIEINPNPFEAYLSVSISYAKKGDWEKSLEFCQKAIDFNPNSYEANNQMGLVYYCCDEVKKAIEYYEKALKLNPDKDYKIYSNLGYAYEKIAQYDKAVKIFTQLLAKFPKFHAKDEIKNHLRILKEQ